MGILNIATMMASAKEAASDANSEIDAVSDASKAFDKFSGAIKKTNAALDRVAVHMQTLNIPMNVIAGGRDLAFTFEKLNIGMAQTTGFSDDLTQGLLDLTVESSELGLSLEDAQRITTELATGFRKFPALTNQVRLGLAKVSVQLQRIGVDMRHSTKSIDIFVSALGHTPEAAAASMESMHLLAQSVGRSTNDIVQEFNSFAPKLLKYGDNYEAVFGRLQKSARAYRLDASEALNITDQFDTFEGAAKKVGALNQMFGRYGLMLNDTAIREMDEAGRIEYLGEQFRNAGIEVSELGRRQRQVLAEQLTGGNQDMLFRFLGGQQKEQTEDYMKQQETLETGAVKMSDTVSQLQGSVQRFFVESGLMQKGTDQLSQMANAMSAINVQGAGLGTYFDQLARLAGNLKLGAVDSLFSAVTGEFQTKRGNTQGVAEAVAGSARKRAEAAKATPVNDLYIPGANGSRRYITGPEGSFQLNDRDSVLAGTELGGGGITAADLEKAVVKGMQTAMKTMNTNRPQTPIEVKIDGRVIGRTVTDYINKENRVFVPS